MDWRVYYGDRSTFDNEEGPFWQAPCLNVQAIIERDYVPEPDNVGRTILSGFDFYWFEGGRWYGGDKFGLFDYLSRSGDTKYVLFGRSIPTEQYRALMNQLLLDPDFPPKSAWRQGERG